MFDTWLYVKPADWDAVDPDLLSQSARSVYEQAITGYWKTYSTGYEVYNILANQSDIDELKVQITDIAQDFRWRQGTGKDELNDAAALNIPADVLAVQKDHVTYDIDGNPISTEAPTFANPNWGHVFFGQSQRIFMGSFSRAFSRAFR